MIDNLNILSVTAALVTLTIGCDSSPVVRTDIDELKKQTNRIENRQVVTSPLFIKSVSSISPIERTTFSANSDLYCVGSNVHSISIAGNFVTLLTHDLATNVKHSVAIQIQNCRNNGLKTICRFHDNASGMGAKIRAAALNNTAIVRVGSTTYLKTAAGTRSVDVPFTSITPDDDKIILNGAAAHWLLTDTGLSGPFENERFNDQLIVSNETLFINDRPLLTQVADTFMHDGILFAQSAGEWSRVDESGTVTQAPPGFVPSLAYPSPSFSPDRKEVRLNALTLRLNQTRLSVVDTESGEVQSFDTIDGSLVAFGTGVLVLSDRTAEFFTVETLRALFATQ